MPPQSPVQPDGIIARIDHSSSKTLEAGRIQSSSDCNGVPSFDARGRQLSIHGAFSTSNMAHVRRFHLAKIAMAYPQGPVGGVRKLKRPGKSSVALLFEEIKSKAKKSPARKGVGYDAVVEQSSGVGLSPRKRPHMRGGKIPPQAQESKEATVPVKTPQEEDAVPGGPTNLGPSEFSELPGWVQDLLSKQLGSAALDGGARPQKPLKIKPTAPALRYRDRHPDHDDGMADTYQHETNGVSEDETEYVYDTYIREPRQYMPNDKNFGLLVVDDETQTVWETFEDAELSNDGEADEEEDENGEDAAVLAPMPTSESLLTIVCK